MGGLFYRPLRLCGSALGGLGRAQPRPGPPLKFWARSSLVRWLSGSGIAFTRVGRPGCARSGLPSPTCCSAHRLRPPIPLPSSLPLGGGRVGRLPAHLQPANTSPTSLSPPCPPIPLQTLRHPSKPPPTPPTPSHSPRGLRARGRNSRPSGSARAIATLRLRVALCRPLALVVAPALRPHRCAGALCAPSSVFIAYGLRSHDPLTRCAMSLPPLFLH